MFSCLSWPPCWLGDWPPPSCGCWAWSQTWIKIYIWQCSELGPPLLLRGVDAAGPGQVVKGLPHPRADPGACCVRLENKEKRYKVTIHMNIKFIVLEVFCRGGSQWTAPSWCLCGRTGSSDMSGCRSHGGQTGPYYLLRGRPSEGEIVVW